MSKDPYVGNKIVMKQREIITTQVLVTLGRGCEWDQALEGVSGWLAKFDFLT